MVPLFCCAVLVAVSIYGLSRDQSPATVTNVSFASVHVLVLGTGVRTLLQRAPNASRSQPSVVRERVGSRS
jgi:hypothetical protein